MFQDLRYTLHKRLNPQAVALKQPVFIVGCGRSGTTILGNVLGHHPEITYLNEPREIWLHEPRTDIWSAEARVRGGQLTLTGEDLIPENGDKIREAFARAVYRDETRYLVEKLPINSFRIGFIQALFPEARFVHIVRNGLEVARSIERETHKYAWYAPDDYKWRLLVAHAEARGLGHLTHQAHTDMFLRGLVEWRLSVSAALESLMGLPESRWMTVRYEGLLATPADVIRELEAFIGVTPNPQTHHLAQETVKNAPPPLALTPVTREIAGELMAQLGYTA